MEELTQQDITRFKREFVAWSESPIGFYTDKRFNEKTMRWEDYFGPIKWTPRQRRWLQHAFTLTEDGDLPYDEVWCIDIGKSGKTMIGAAVAQWLGLFSELPGEILLAANAASQAQVRTFRTLRRSLSLSPAPMVEDTTKSEIRWKERKRWIDGRLVIVPGNTARAVPLNAETQAGTDALAWIFDETWAYTTDQALKMVSEAKASPTQNVSLRLFTTYPGFKQDSGPLNDVLDTFFDEGDEERPGVEQVAPGLPLWRYGSTLLWWNHDPYPWHQRVVQGMTFLERQRQQFKGRENEYRRIWEARLVSREDSFIHPRSWHDCEDMDWHPLGPDDRGVLGIIGADVGVKRDSFALVMRGYDPATRRYPLLAHKIWTPIFDPDRPDAPAEVPLDEAKQWILDMVRRQRVLYIYIDPSNAGLLIQELRAAFTKMGSSVKIVEVEQGKMRFEADMAYRDLIHGGTLRNYPQCADLTQHVLDATAKYSKGGRFSLDKFTGGYANFRMVKGTQSRYVHIDGAVADAQACLGVSEHVEEFTWAVTRRPRTHKQLSNPYRDTYMRQYDGKHTTPIS